MGSKRICIFIRTLSTGGAEKQSVLLAKALNDKFDVFLVIQRGTIVEEKYINYLLKHNIKLILLKGRLIRRLYTFFKFLKVNNIQIIFSYLTSDNLWSALIGKLAGVDHLIGGIRNVLLPRQKFLITKLLHIWLQDYTIFNSYAGYKNFINKGFIREKSLVINNYIDFVPSYYQRKQTKNLKILTVARFTEQKDYETAIKSFHYFLNKMCPAGVKVSYIIIGFGKLEAQLNNWIKDYNLIENIDVVVKPNNIHEYYLNSDIYLSTSIFEGFSNSIMEAMSYSLPILATDVGDNGFLVENDITGFLTPVKDYNKLAEKMLELVKSYDKRVSFGKAGYDMVKENYSFINFQRNYLKLINSLS